MVVGNCWAFLSSTAREAELYVEVLRIGFLWTSCFHHVSLVLFYLTRIVIVSLFCEGEAWVISDEIHHVKLYLSLIISWYWDYFGIRVIFANPMTCSKSRANFITVLNRVHLDICANRPSTIFVVIGTDCICSCKSKYHTITATSIPTFCIVLSNCYFHVHIPADKASNLTDIP